MLLNACKIIEKKNDPPIILLSIEEITERMRLEDLLKEAEARYRRVYETATDGIVLLDKREGSIVHANPATKNMLGYSEEEYIGKKLRDIGVPLDLSNFPSVMQALDKSGIINYDDVLITTKSGHAIYADIYMVDRARLAQCNIREITERKKSEASLLRHTEELETVNRELEAFIYNISHDLRAPLRHISGFTELVMKDAADKLDGKDKQHLSRIYAASEKMNRIIDDLLNLARISRQDISREEVDMSTIAASIVAELREAYPGRSVDADIREGLKAFADPGMIGIVLSNLIGNAWKFTAKKEHARIEVGTVEQEDKIVYFVRDNGVGFDQKYADKMFWPFHRLHSDDAFEGTGMGLAIVDRIVRGHGGKAWAEGDEGKGATIYFSLT
jgi:PAS domain S-box-containing protein